MKKEKVIKNILSAFEGVKLENGIGLIQGERFDNPCIDEKDERFDWRKITHQQIDKYYGGIYFVDAKGMRFTLPAILLDEINSENLVGGVGSNSYPYMKSSLFDCNYYSERFSLLSDAQIEAIIHYLIYIIEESWNFSTYDDCDREDIYNRIIDWKVFLQHR